MYNIFAELKKNIEDFNQNKVVLVKKPSDTSARYLAKKDMNYVFSQPETLAIIDLYMSSQFEKGKFDSEGQRKVFLNKVRFVRDVSRMRTDIDVKNYVFNPDTFDDIWGTYFMQRKFKLWARENEWGETLNALQDDYCTYGTAVSKKVGDEIYRVPLQNLMNKQDVDTLDESAECAYVIEKHKMTRYEMEEMKGWDASDLDYDKEYEVYERYSMVPESVVRGEISKNPSKEKRVLAMQILVPEVTETKGQEDGKILFIEKVKEIPYQEVFWEKVHGRWLGRGPVENQLEAQVAANMTANLRRRALLWSSKKLFQTASEEVAKNLVKDVKDGEVLFVGTNGVINPVAMETRNMAEFASDEAVWDNNSQKTSFTFEVATGESMPSGTPFRMGVILSNAVDSYFNLKKEQFGLYLKRSFFKQMIPIFIEEVGEHTLSVAQTQDGAQLLQNAMTDYYVGRSTIDHLSSGKIPVTDIIRTGVEDKLIKSPYLFVNIPEGFYNDVKYHMELDITDEATDTKTEIETLTTMFQVLAQKGDPRAENVMQMILAKTGKNFNAIVGMKQKPPQGSQVPDMTGMMQGQTPGQMPNIPGNPGSQQPQMMGM